RNILLSVGALLRSATAHDISFERNGITKRERINLIRAKAVLTFALAPSAQVNLETSDWNEQSETVT
ncbi:MAG: hypothetical protein ACTS5F_00885, partial [Candidatus Hodgkinia cicadicola]